MKLTSLHVSENDYQDLKSLAARTGRSVAEVIREAMAQYLERERRGAHSIFDLEPHDSGSLRRDWTRDELVDEILDR